jgi:hypothetical protein
MSDDEQKMYLEERKLLIDAERDAANSRDKTLITLSSGAIVLSFAFVKDMKTPCVGEWLLFLAWISFIASLLSIVLSFLFSEIAMRRQREIIDMCHVKDDWDSNEKNPYCRWIDFLNIASVCLLAVGVVFFAFFAASNLPRSAVNVGS